MNPNQCSFCGRKKSEVEILISGKDGYICENCVEQAHVIVKESVGSASFVPAQSIDELKKPREIKAFLDEYVIGQDQAKKIFSALAKENIPQAKESLTLVDKLIAEQSKKSVKK